MQCSEQIIQKFASARMMKALAAVLMIKKKVPHGVIEKYSTRGVARLLGLSERTTKKYLKIILSFNDVAVVHNGDLYIRKLAAPKHLCTIKFEPTSTLAFIEKYLYSKIIFQYQKQQAFCENRKREEERLIQRPRSAKDMSKRKKILAKYSDAEGKLKSNLCFVPYEVRMPISSLTKRLTVSKRKFLDIVKFLKEENHIQVIPQVFLFQDPFEDPETPRWIYSLMEKSYFWFSGKEGSKIMHLVYGNTFKWNLFKV
jgi:hypothetical protein